MEISKLEGLKRQAERDGWAQFIRTPVDEKALLRGHTFSWEAFDHFRFFVEKFIKLTKGSQWVGRPMELLPWHEIVTGSLFGWIKPDGLRRFRRGYIEVPKKNSKTTLFAAIGLYMLGYDGEASSEVYTCANSKDQAAILWNIAADMVEADQSLKDLFTVLRSTRRIFPDHSSWFAAWSSDVSSKDGPNAHCILVDELHEWKGSAAREFWGKIRYAGIAREQPFCPLTITTAGDDRYSLCWEQRVAAKKIIDGISEDLAMFACIYGADPEKMKADPNYWKTPECWKESNPAYGTILKQEDFESDVAAVENDPVEKARFWRYRLGVWIDSDNPWLKSGTWEKNKGPDFTETDMAGQLCYGGLDLSSVHDFTASLLVFPYMARIPESERKEGERAFIKKFRLLARIYCPEDTFAERVRKDDSGSLRLWHEQGYIRLTPGDSIDHSTIYEDIEKDSETFQIKQFAYDRNSAAWIVQEIQKKIPHIELFPFSQSMAGMSSPTKAFTVCLQKGLIEHGGNPVLGWMAGNAVVEINNAQENMMLHKGKSKDKIDGIVAAIMGYNQAELGTMGLEKKFSPYSNEGFEAIKRIEGIQKEGGKSDT
jgi:phage terminase large subunit-like protein